MVNFFTFNYQSLSETVTHLLKFLETENIFFNKTPFIKTTLNLKFHYIRCQLMATILKTFDDKNYFRYLSRSADELKLHCFFGQK